MKPISQYYEYEPAGYHPDTEYYGLIIKEVDDVINCKNDKFYYKSTGEQIFDAVKFVTRGTSFSTPERPEDKQHPLLTCYRALNCDLIVIEDTTA